MFLTLHSKAFTDVKMKFLKFLYFIIKDNVFLAIGEGPMLLHSPISCTLPQGQTSGNLRCDSGRNRASR
jgi:hypothetical protein